MTRTAPSTKYRGKTAKKDSSGGNRGLGLILAGFTALVIAAIAAVAMFSTLGSTDTGNFTPNDDGQDNPGKERDFVEEYDIGSPAVYEPSLGQKYDVSGYPTVYVLDGSDEVVGAHSGEAPRDVYEGWIEEAL